MDEGTTITFWGVRQPPVQHSSLFRRRASGRGIISAVSFRGCVSSRNVALEPAYCRKPVAGLGTSTIRGVAQTGSALAWGASGRGFKSRRPDSSICVTRTGDGVPQWDSNFSRRAAEALR